MGTKPWRFLHVLVFLLAIAPATAHAQFDKKKERKSLPERTTANIDGVKVVIEYGAPEAKNRRVFGELVPYGQLWRTGANEATTFEISDAVEIGGQTLEEGKYALFTIPDEKEWILIFNSEYDQWGDFNYDEKRDVLRVNVSPEATDFHEVMEFAASKNGKLYLYWENTAVPFQITSIKKK